MTVEHVFVSRSKYYILMGSINQVLINKVELSIKINHNVGKKNLYAIWNMSWRVMPTCSIAYKRTVNKLHKRKKHCIGNVRILVVFTSFCREAGAQAAGGNGIWVLLQILSVLEWILVILIVVRISEWGRKFNPFWGISGIPSMNNKILYWMHVHRSLKMQLRLLSCDRDKIIHIYMYIYIQSYMYTFTNHVISSCGKTRRLSLQWTENRRRTIEEKIAFHRIYAF